MPPQTLFCPCRVSVRRRFLWEANRMLSNSMQYKFKNLSSFKCTNSFHTFGEKTGIYLLLQPSNEKYNEVHLGGNSSDGYMGTSKVNTAATFAGRKDTIACFFFFLMGSKMDESCTIHSLAHRCPIPSFMFVQCATEAVCSFRACMETLFTCCLRYL